MIRAISYMLFGVLITLCVAKVTNMEYQDVKEKERRYCEMVQVFNETNGYMGWPDFDGDYAKMCKKYIV